MNHEIKQLKMQLANGTEANTGSVLTQLRHLLPSTIHSEEHAKHVAGRLATKLRKLLTFTHDPAFPSSAIEQLPRLLVHYHPEGLHGPNGTTQSGLTGWSPEARQWHIHINGTDHPLRQRFSLMHEYAHVITGHVTKSPISTERFIPSIGTYTAAERLERFCDAFAANLLMPRRIVKQAWASGHQDARALSRLFGVSPMAARVRLHDLGLVDGSQRRRPYFGRAVHFRTAQTDPGVSQDHDVLAAEPVIGGAAA